MIVGVISDTHGLLRPEALERLRGVEHILHAGDVGGAGILNALQAVAPVTAIRGNIGTGPAWASLPAEARLELAGWRILVLHDLKALGGAPEADIVVSGHSHRPLVERRGGVLYLNPGAAGPRRFRLPVSVATLMLGPEPKVCIHDLTI